MLVIALTVKDGGSGHVTLLAGLRRSSPAASARPGCCMGCSSHSRRIIDGVVSQKISIDDRGAQVLALLVERQVSIFHWHIYHHQRIHEKLVTIGVNL
jgi:hypothetical protein